jgi:choline kinase
MKAIILSAGQGNRLLPLTEHTPKCLLPVQDDASVLEFQLRILAACGVTEAAVIVGFGAEQVEACLAERPVSGIDTYTVFNPFYAVSDNLATAWLARSEMDQDFVLVNGDTLFTEDVLRRLLSAPVAPLTLAVNVKDHYDADDMKVSLVGRRLKAVGKQLDANVVNGESIGLMCFRGRGVKAFRDALEHAIRGREGLSRWYLSVVNSLADWLSVQTADITGMWWGEIDCPEDLTEVRKALSGISAHSAEATEVTGSSSRARYAK